MPKTIPKIKIENVVASATVNQRIDLIEITKKFTHVEYNPKQFPGLVFRIKNPKTAILIFNSGKMVCTGGKSEKLAKIAIKSVVASLKEKNIEIKKRATVTIQNIVASVDLGGKIDLEEAARQLSNSMYEPEQFPGLIYRMKEPKTVILIFSSGKLVCTGAKIESQVKNAVDNLHKLLEKKKLMLY
tara:strand:+ start:458 stop:1015 length:558 start_codon:yes stop_codon:yes gene_type:complete